MKRALAYTIVVLGTLAATQASAWDGPTLWYEPAHGANPGGGGIFGTGGARDHNITCEHCHVERPVATIDAALVFTPPLGEAGGVKLYTPGQTYQVRVDLIGEFLGMSGCGAYAKNINNFAATFEAGGQTTGLLTSDSGQSQAACPTDYPMTSTGTTALYRDCDVVLATDIDENRTWWTFSWRAPDAGTGMVTASYGVVDGDCSMMSMGDAVKMGKLEMAEASAAAAPRSKRRGGELATVLLLPVALLVARRRALALVAALALIGCGGSGAADGTLGGACLPGDVCNAGLVCVDGVCESGDTADAGPDGGGGGPDAAAPDANPAAPTCVITSPADPSEARFDEDVTFQATATDPEDGPLTGASVGWSSNLDGQLGNGLAVTTTLTPGVHTVTCLATDSDGNTGAYSVQVTSRSPYADIFHPGDGEMRAAGSLIPFTGIGRDFQDGNLSGTQLLWTSDLTGFFGEGEMFTAPLTAGTHVITLTATDTDGNTGTASITLIITP